MGGFYDVVNRILCVPAGWHSIGQGTAVAFHVDTPLGLFGFFHG